MGHCFSTLMNVIKNTSNYSQSKPIEDKFKSLDEVSYHLKKAGLESCNLIIGIDYTESNNSQGTNTFFGKSLHAIDFTNQILNPYQEVITIIGRTLSSFDEDGMIDCFGFGDLATKGHTVFPFFENNKCFGLEEVLRRYTEITPSRRLSGPTSFVPLINKAVEIVKQSGDYHILLIIGDGQVTNIKENIDAIVNASYYALSIIMIGVGDGPWEYMKEFDDQIPIRQFDNFQFVDFHKIKNDAGPHSDVHFAFNALMEIPEQYQLIKKFGLIK